MLSLASIVVLLAPLAQISALHAGTYRCSVCLKTAAIMQSSINSNKIADGQARFQAACEEFFPQSVCADAVFRSALVAEQRLSAEDKPRTYCERLALCEAISYADTSAGFDVRVTKALGSKGYDKLRVSVVSNSTISSPYLSYSEQFKYRWTDKFLSSGIVSVTPGVKQSINIAGKDIALYVPKQGEGVRGLLLGDPCFQSEWIVCEFAKSLKTFDRTTALLNAMNQHDDIHFFQLLGDNFYDQQGQATSTWFAALSDQTKSKIFATVPGNHDFWVNASPELHVNDDQLGHGFMQFYGQDTKAATDASPYDFSVNPDAESARVGRDDNAWSIPPAENFFYYNQLGNVAFFGYSGAHTFSSMASHFDEACNWAAANNPAAIVLTGHWDKQGDGCEEESAVPNVYAELVARPACAPLKSKFKYFEGHRHCNVIMEKDVGFMVGGAGMLDFGLHPCGGELGLPILDTTGGSFKVYYFKVATNSFQGGEDHYDEVMDCFNTKGVSGCYHLATLWSDVPF